MIVLLDLKHLRNKVRFEHKKWSSINYFVQSADFEIIYDKATIEERRKLTEAAISGDQQFFKKFVKGKKYDLTPFQKLSYRKLKDIGKFLRIPGYYTLSKIVLIKEIEDEVQRIKADSKQIISKSQC